MRPVPTPRAGLRPRIVPNTPSAGSLRLALAVLIVVTLVGAPGARPRAGQQTVVEIPDPDIGVDTLAERREAQLATAGEFGVFVDFTFEDRVADSGITFVHRIVDDADKTYKAAHYDHGNGLSAADVDGDGRLDLYFTNQMGANELWRAVGDGTFENVTESAGVGLEGGGIDRSEASEITR